MAETRFIELEDGRRIYVDIEGFDGDEPTPVPPSFGRRLPEGAQPTGLADDARIAIQLLRDQIGAVADTVYQSLKANRPDEWTVEMVIGFKGKTSPIPVILTGEVNGGIKVTAKWKKGADG